MPPAGSGHLVRGVALIASVLLVAGAQLAFSTPSRQSSGWWLLLATIVMAAVWQSGLTIADRSQALGQQWRLTPRRWRWVAGGLLVLGAAAMWFDATRELSVNWAGNFDRSWLTWFVATGVMSLGFRLLQTPVTPAQNRLSRWEWAVLAVAFAVTVAFRIGDFGGIGHFPPDDAVSQVEELQAGQFGAHFLAGDRSRWEFASQAAIAGLGIWLGGPTLHAVREAFAVINLLKVLPAYFLFRALAGPAGAMIGTALLAVSGWDTIVTRMPGHPDGLVTMCCLALLVGPAVRGKWAVYPWVGLLVGYSTITYIAFRPLIGFALVAVVIANLVRSQLPSWRRWVAAAGWATVVAVLAAGIFIPLTYRLEDRFMFEYLNGWNRAHAQEEYYGSQDSWSVAIQKRWERTSRAAGLFYTEGDGNPCRNVNGRPQVDPVTGSLLLLGLGYCAWMCLRGFYGVMLVAFGLTFVGTVVITGDFNPLRLWATIQYVYILAAIGAGGLAAAAERSFGRIGRLTAMMLLWAGVAVAGGWNAKLVWDLWTSPLTRQHYRSDLAYLSKWLRENASGKRVIGLIPTNANVVFVENDASWLRGNTVRGTATWDVRDTSRQLSKPQGDVILLISAPAVLHDAAVYFESILPGVRFEFPGEQTKAPTQIAYATVTTPAFPADSPVVRDGACTGARARFDLRREQGELIETVAVVVPFIDTMTWPARVREAAERHERDGRWIDASWEADFTIEQAGTYVFFPESYEGAVVATIDGKRIPGETQMALMLAAGPHHFTMNGRFNMRSLEPTTRLSWSGPSNNEFHVVPFYRLVPRDAPCVGTGEPVPAAVPDPGGNGA